MSEQFKRFLKWAGEQSYDTAHTCNSDTGEWLCFSPMTADLWKAWQACVAEIDTSAERVQKTAKSVHVDEELRKDAEREVLAKLAGMELPEPVQIGLVEVDWNHFKPAKGYTAAQLHQAFAQGAASQLAKEPSAWMTFDGEGNYEYRSYEDNENYAEEWQKRNPNYKLSGWVFKLYTPREPS